MAIPSWEPRESKQTNKLYDSAIEIASRQTKPAFAGLRNKESRVPGFCT
jgi:hypothetical protein